MSGSDVVDAAAASLEAASEAIKRLSVVGGVEALTQQVQTLHGSSCKHHMDLVAEVAKVREEFRSLSANFEDIKTSFAKSISDANERTARAIEAQAHRAFAAKVTEIMTPKEQDMYIIVSVAEMYGWAIPPHPHGSKEDRAAATRRTWKQAADALKIVTVPGMSYNGASYNKYVRSAA